MRHARTPGDPAPIFFSRLWQGLALHTQREVDDKVVFAYNPLPSYWGVYIREYALAYSFVITLRILRRISPDGVIEISSGEEPDSVALTIFLKDPRDRDIGKAIAPYLPIMKSILAELETPSTVSLGQGGFALTYSLPLYRGKETSLCEGDVDYIELAVEHALAASL